MVSGDICLELRVLIMCYVNKFALVTVKTVSPCFWDLMVWSRKFYYSSDYMPM